MSEYNYNFEDRDNMYEYSCQGGDLQGACGQKSKKQPGGKAGRGIKKMGAVVLSAVLFGTVAAGTFQAVNYAAGYTIYSGSAGGGFGGETGQAGRSRRICCRLL